MKYYKDRDQLYKAFSRFDFESYIQAIFDKIVPSGAHELRVDCFSPNGCAGSDSKAHLWINIQKKAWICYKCGYGDNSVQKGSGFLPRFIADAEGIPIRQAIDRILNEYVGTPEESLLDILEQAFDEIENPTTEIKDPPIMQMPKEFHSLHKATGVLSKKYAAYAIQRGFEKDQQQMYDMRFCVSPITSLDKKYQNTFVQRIIWPIYDAEGNLRSAVARDMSGSSKRPKWVNWPDTEPSFYLWPMGRWIPQHGWHPYSLPARVVLTEGIINAYAIECLSARVARACFGKKISDEQIQILIDGRVQEVVLAWDYDAKDKMIKAAKRLSVFFKVFVFPYHHPDWKKNLDFGDAFDSSSPLHSVVRSELETPIDVESTEFCKWACEQEIERENNEFEF